MIRKFLSMAAAGALALATLAPAPASAEHERDRDRDNRSCANDGVPYNCPEYRNRGYGGYGGYDCRYDRYGCRGRDYDRHRRHRDDDDDGEAIAAGVIGLVLGLAIGAAAEQNQRRDGYDNRRYDDRRYSDDYYEPQRPQCTRRERQWDRYAQRYVYVDVPC